MTVTGTITTAKTVGNVVMKFTSCPTAGNKCTTAGRPSGELESKTLEGVLGFERATLKEGKETRYAGLDLYPVGKVGVFMEFICGEGTTPTKLSGSVIGQIATEKMFTTQAVTYVESAGKQKPEGFVGGEKDTLVTSKGQQTGLKVKLVQAAQESLEINAWF